jgi:hypothetical protein
MLCYECGYQDSTVDGPHTCSEADLKRAAKRRRAGAVSADRSPGASWVLPATFWTAIVAAVVIAVVNLARLVVLGREYSAVSRLGSPPTAAQRADAFAAINTVHDFVPLTLLAVVLYVVVVGVWSSVARRITRALRVSPAELRHWTKPAMRIGVAVILVVLCASRQTQPVTDLASARAAELRIEAGQIIYAMLSIAFAGLVIVGVRAQRERLAELTREKAGARPAPERDASQAASR